jgi:hypothetical protein
MPIHSLSVSSSRRRSPRKHFSTMSVGTPRCSRSFSTADRRSVCIRTGTVFVSGRVSHDWEPARPRFARRSTSGPSGSRRIDHSMREIAPTHAHRHEREVLLQPKRGGRSTYSRSDRARSDSAKPRSCFGRAATLFEAGGGAVAAGRGRSVRGAGRSNVPVHVAGRQPCRVVFQRWCAYGPLSDTPLPAPGRPGTGRRIRAGQERVSDRRVPW